MNAGLPAFPDSHFKIRPENEMSQNWQSPTGWTLREQPACRGQIYFLSGCQQSLCAIGGESLDGGHVKKANDPPSERTLQKHRFSAPRT
jgi:hypothetical protein